MKKLIIAFVALGLVATLAFAADAKKPDAEILIGTWKAIEGKYFDGSVEKDLKMEFTFTKTTMSVPMGKANEVVPYTVDDKAKIIKAKGETSETTLSYSLIDEKTLKFTSLKVVAKGKTLEIIGPTEDAMFVSMTLTKK